MRVSKRAFLFQFKSEKGKTNVMYLKNACIENVDMKIQRFFNFDFYFNTEL